MATRVPMPEAPMHEDDTLEFWQYHVGPSGEARDMQPVAQSCGMKKSAHTHFWLRVPWSYGAHHA